MSAALFRLRGLPPATNHHFLAFASITRVAFQSSELSRLVSSTREEVNHPNRYDRFRDCLRLAANISHADSVSRATKRIHNALVFKEDDVDPMDIAKCTMEIMSSNRRSFKRTWDRMSPLIELILLSCSSRNNNKRMQSIADVGCDHGMLALSLACIAWANQSRGDDDQLLFSRVFGTDLSSQALENGGVASLKKVNDALSRIDVGNNNKTLELPIQFRVGDGLSALQPGESDAVVIAGMGVHTMIDSIILGTSETAAPIESLESDYLFLQPTNSRPQHLIILYDGLQKKLGWELSDERIAFVGGRWYISSYFRRNDNERDFDLYRFPGHYLLDDQIFDTYVRHHLKWLEQLAEKGPLEEEDARWVKHVLSLTDKSEWKILAAWYKQTKTEYAGMV